MDLQSLLTNLFTILAFALPVFLILAHTQREGWKLSPPVYAGIVGMLASFAMMARQSGFLESQIGAVSTGWFSSDMIIAMILAFLAAMNLAVFDWMVPGLRLRLESIPESLKAYLTQSGKRKADSEFRLMEEAIPDEQGFLQTLLSMAWALFSSLLLIIALGIYLLWPSLVLTTDQHRIEIEIAEENQKKTLATLNQRNLEARATNVGAMANELVSELKRKSRYCKTDSCTTWTSNHYERVLSEIEGYGFKLKGDVYPVAEFIRRLDTWDLVKSLQSRLHDMARNRNVRLQSATRPEAFLEYKPAIIDIDPAAIATKDAKDTARLVGKLLGVIANPREAMAMLTKDIITSIAIAMECAAIILAFFSGAARRQCAN